VNLNPFVKVKYWDLKVTMSVNIVKYLLRMSDILAEHINELKKVQVTVRNREFIDRA